MNPSAMCKRVLTGLSFVLAISGIAGAQVKTREFQGCFRLPYEAETVTRNFAASEESVWTAPVDFSNLLTSDN